ncbi:hypothetical protein IQ273_14290 [Nodosilinea sp. LEGE 07298]|uniref:hypothetical protein n=1 Tax=Nodosilinea sp. LEGE 07298 TaxID=2777970 RepID=UPI0018804358|nr:hypothetical protein [Nodosilinea sp. LEGE 07298]MBE9110586.1 hypothetical protein [Nodosilinea sp. LEGE 07298]
MLKASSQLWFCRIAIKLRNPYLTFLRFVAEPGPTCYSHLRELLTLVWCKGGQTVTVSRPKRDRPYR